MKILQNQPVFTPPYSLYVEYLYQKIPVFVGKLIKTLPYKEFFEGIIEFIIFIIRRRYDVCVTVGHRQAIIVALLNRIFRSKIKHVVKELFIDEKSFYSKFKTIIYRWAFKEVKLIITNSSGEIPYLMKWLKLPVFCFKFIPWPSNIPTQENKNSKYSYDIFAAGRSFRDWETFFNAINGTDLKCCIVANKKDFRNMKLPNGFNIYYNIPYNEYLYLLEISKVVVIPLKNTFRSIGQASILEAMAFGKPVVTAKVIGTIDYIYPAINGLFYEPGNAKSLKNTILRIIKDDDFQSKIGEKARKSIKQFYNKENYSKWMLKTISEVCSPE